MQELIVFVETLVRSGLDIAFARPLIKTLILKCYLCFEAQGGIEE